MLPALTLLSFGTALAKGMGQIQQGYADADALAESARIDEENARFSIYKGESDVTDMRRQQGAFTGQQRAAIAQSGLGEGGTNAALVAQSAEGMERDVGNTRIEAALKATGFQRKATQSRSASGASRTAGIIGAGTTLLSTAADYYAQKRTLK